MTSSDGNAARRTAAGRRLGMLLAASLLVGACSEPPPPSPATTLIGFDGMDWRNALPLLRQGKLPTFAALRRAGASGTMMSNPDFRFSPVLWTTIATGKLPQKHGVFDFRIRNPRPDLPSIPTPSTARRCRALWNIFTERERTVGFVGWWVTWPAETVNGFMVSDHFSVSRFKLGRGTEENVRNPHFYERQTYPESLIDEILDLKYPRRKVSRDDLARFADLPADFQWPEEFRKFDKVSEFVIAHAVDRTHVAAGSKLLAERRPELFGIYFQGVDVMQHFFWEFMDPAGPGTDPPLERRAIWGESIESYYRFSDALVASLIESGGSERAVLLLSDHGFRPDTGRWEAKGISGEHRREAFFLYAGPGVRRGLTVGDFDAVDATPTILAYHGLPVGEDMDGEAVTRLFTDEWRELRPLRMIETYEVGEWDRGELPDASFSRDLEERIRALGYID